MGRVWRFISRVVEQEVDAAEAFDRGAEQSSTEDSTETSVGTARTRGSAHGRCGVGERRLLRPANTTDQPAA